MFHVRNTILAEWESLKSTTNQTGMTTLKEIMSENITTSEKTVFQLVHKRMETMNKIDQPIKSFARGFTASARKIQKHYDSIVKYIKDFDRLMKKRREQVIECRNGQEEYHREKQKLARMHAEAISQGVLDPSFKSSLSTFDSPKRRRIESM